MDHRVNEKSEILDILERISDAFLAVSNDWRITYINQKALTITNRKSEEVIGKNLWSVFPEDFLSDFASLAKKALATQQHQHHEAYFQPYNRWFESHIYPSATGLSIYLNDITARKKTEIKLSESERRLHTIIQVEPECVKILGANCELLEMNPAGLAMIEADNLDQVRGHSVLRLVSPRYRDSFEKLTRDVFEGISGVMEFEMISLKGTQRWIETHAVPLRNDEEKVISLLGVSRDVTDRKIAEKRYRDIFDNILTGIYQTTPEGKFITANPAMARMFGYASPEELIDSVNDISSEIYANPGDRTEIQSLLEKHGQIHGRELKVLKRNREVMWVRINNRAVKDHLGNTLYFEGTLEDITQSKRAERKLQKQFKELQKTNHELDRFVYSTSHDLRAPLASILGLINIAELEQIPETQRSYLQMIRSNINRLDGFIKDILDYSKNSRSDVKISKVNFKFIIDDLRQRLKLTASNLQIDTQIDDDVPFYSDQNRTEIILNNLFSNAVKFQDTMKEASFISIRVRVSPETATITFSDNGIGIESKYVEKVFDMFFRATEKAKGSGLGLYIVKEAVAKLGGTIELQSEFGVSTTFEVRIPNLRWKVQTKTL
jgi:PAS domain S-box-containing protein